MFTVKIVHGKKTIVPIVLDGMSLTSTRAGTPSILKLNILLDDKLEVSNGDAVALYEDDTGVFLGYIFSIKESSDKVLSLTAYDQLRYLKNRETYVYSNKTADAVINMIANDFNLKVKSIAKCKHVIKSRIEDNQTLFDTIQNALDDELVNNGKMYVLYDDFGGLVLQDIDKLKVPIIIDADTFQTFSYNTSIDSNVYNKVKLYRDNNSTGKRDTYVVSDNKSINAWGVLQMTKQLKEGENGKAKAESLLKLYNTASRSLTVNGVFGDMRVRAGCSVAVNLKLNDIDVSSWMLVEQCTHNFNGDEHTMNLKLRGGVINNG